MKYNYNFYAVIKDANTVVGCIISASSFRKKYFQAYTLEQLREFCKTNKVEGIYFNEKGDIEFEELKKDLITEGLTKFQGNKGKLGILSNLLVNLTPYRLANLFRYKKSDIEETENGKVAVCIASIENFNNVITASISAYGRDEDVKLLVKDLCENEIFIEEDKSMNRESNGFSIGRVYLYDLLDFQKEHKSFNISVGGYLHWFADCFVNHGNLVIKLTDEQLDYVLDIVNKSNNLAKK